MTTLLCMQLLPVISGTVEEALLRWLRAAELTCDRAALLVAQVPLLYLHRCCACCTWKG